ncbi:hypothetical protein O7602_20830 [Micromonospora sp. WMMD1128]|uniref:hypothetical protein n=1 Tax=unclassified Micromonospora TaxID=2617518 RepID=UPI00248B74B8|nr:MULTISPECIES: hypothetical protein [unclassified Micromonospora]WBB72151.1 hypothetical protein O7602_20830 [Micromonospora sp. WMMD1128]WFE34386.1 hypothetical protein O7613_03035 [Micromonospora sp. WMMD975]
MTRSAAMLVVTGALLATAGCAADETAQPDELRDPCALLPTDLLARLAPGAQPSAAANLGDRSGSRECAVDLTSGTSMRGDLAVTVAVDAGGMYDDRWRRDRCARIATDLTDAGPGDASCVAVKAWDGGETRFDGWAWRGDHYEVRVAYQVVKPQTLPAGAEADLRGVLASAVDSLPA